MSKLLKFREWLTVEESARHLSMMFGEDVGEADILRLVLDGHLVLSVHFVNHAKANPARVIPLPDAPMSIVPKQSKNIREWFHLQRSNVWPDEVDNLPEEIKKGLDSGDLILSIKGTPLNDAGVMLFESEVETLDGVWDLPMIGSERLDVEHWYQQLTGGPEVKLTNLEGTFVRSPEGRLFRLLESWDNNEYQAGSLAHLEVLKASADYQFGSDEERQTILKQHAKEREEFRSFQSSLPRTERYFPAGALPEGSVFVVRTAQLRTLNTSDEERAEREMGARERNKYNSIIAAMAMAGWGWNGEAPYALAKEIARDASLKGVKVSERTLGGKLKEASENMKGNE